MYPARSACCLLVSLSLILLLHSTMRAEDKTHAEDKQKPETATTKIRRLQLERIEVLRESVKFVTVAYRQGTLDFERVVSSQRKWLDAKLEVAETRAERISVLAEQLKLAQQLLEFADQKFRVGLSTQLGVWEAKSAALRIEIELMKLRQLDTPQDDR